MVTAGPSATPARSGLHPRLRDAPPARDSRPAGSGLQGRAAARRGSDDRRMRRVVRIRDGRLVHAGDAVPQRGTVAHAHRAPVGRRPAHSPGRARPVGRLPRERLAPPPHPARWRPADGHFGRLRLLQRQRQAGPLPRAGPPPEAWPVSPAEADGYPLITAPRAFEEFTPPPGTEDPPTTTWLQTTTLQLGTAAFESDRGAIQLPAWSFTFDQSTGSIAVLAVAPASVYALPTPLTSPTGTALAGGADLGHDDRTLTVSSGGWNPGPHPAMRATAFRSRSWRRRWGSWWTSSSTPRPPGWRARSRRTASS